MATMRQSLAVIVALLSLAIVPHAFAGEPARELVVQLSEPALAAQGYRAVQPGALPAAVRSRFASLGLHASRALSEHSIASERVLPEMFAFHPERIILVDAPDAADRKSVV